MPTALAIAQNVLLLLEASLEVDHALRPLVVRTNQILREVAASGRDPSSAEWAELDAKLVELRAALAP